MKKLHWVLLVILLFVPFVIDLVFINDLFLFAQKVFAYYKYATAGILFSDILFTEGAVLLILGALIGGVTVYNAWAQVDVRKAQFTEFIWNLKKIREERNYPTGLIIGLTLIAIGIIYIIMAIFLPGLSTM